MPISETVSHGDFMPVRTICSNAHVAEGVIRDTQASAVRIRSNGTCDIAVGRQHANNHVQMILDVTPGVSIGHQEDLFQALLVYFTRD